MTIYYKGNDSNNKLAATNSFPYREIIEMYGYAGNDELQGAFLHINTIYGGPGDDIINGGAMANSLHGEDGNDTINAWMGEYSELYGGAGDDTLSGGDKGSTLDGGTGNDSMYGGDGADTYYVSSLHDLIFETYTPYYDNDPNPNDTIISSISYTLGSNIETLSLSDTESINGVGNNLNNLINGNPGSNILSGLEGNDAIDGGAGIDTASYSLNRNAYTIKKTGQGFSVQANQGDEGTDTLTNVERLRFSDKSIALDTTDNALNAIQFIGVIAPSLLNHSSTNGLILGLFDQGYSMKQLCELALNLGLVPSDDKALAEAVFKNITGQAPDQSMANFLEGFIRDNGDASFLATVAEMSLNIDIVGLQQNGLEFI